jgi:hypothetical protein
MSFSFMKNTRKSMKREGVRGGLEMCFVETKRRIRDPDHNVNYLSCPASKK